MSIVFAVVLATLQTTAKIFVIHTTLHYMLQELHVNTQLHITVVSLVDIVETT